MRSLSAFLKGLKIPSFYGSKTANERGIAIRMPLPAKHILRYYEKALNLFVGAESDQPHFEWPQLMQTGQLFW